jgi:hypothetical protein
LTFAIVSGKQISHGNVQHVERKNDGSDITNDNEKRIKKRYRLPSVSEGLLFVVLTIRGL